MTKRCASCGQFVSSTSSQLISGGDKVVHRSGFGCKKQSTEQTQHLVKIVVPRWFSNTIGEAYMRQAGPVPISVSV